MVITLGNNEKQKMPKEIAQLVNNTNKEVNVEHKGKVIDQQEGGTPMEITHEFPTEVPMHEAQCLDENSKVPQHAPRPPVQRQVGVDHHSQGGINHQLINRGI